MYKTVFCYEIIDTMFLGYFYGNWELVRGFRREADIDGFLDELRVRPSCVVYNMSTHIPYMDSSTAHLRKL